MFHFLLLFLLFLLNTHIYSFSRLRCPNLRVGTFHGTSRRQRQFELEKVMRRGGVCLTTYGERTIMLGVTVCFGFFPCQLAGCFLAMHIISLMFL